MKRVNSILNVSCNLSNARRYQIGKVVKPIANPHASTSVNFSIFCGIYDSVYFVSCDWKRQYSQWFLRDFYGQLETKILVGTAIQTSQFSAN